jgi:hypothetical protein
VAGREERFNERDGSTMQTRATRVAAVPFNPVASITTRYALEISMRRVPGF